MGWVAVEFGILGCTRSFGQTVFTEPFQMPALPGQSRKSHPDHGLRCSQLLSLKTVLWKSCCAQKLSPTVPHP
jgi:hypothetical protein